MAYAEPADLETLVGGDVANAALLLDLASGAVDDEVGRPLGEDSYTETFAPDGKVLWLVAPGWPASVTEVVDDGETLSTPDGYTLRPDGALVRAEGTWGQVTVTYTTGFGAGSPALATAKRITLEVAAQAAANPQLLDSLNTDGTNLGFRRGSSAIGLDSHQRDDLTSLKWRRRFA